MAECGRSTDIPRLMAIPVGNARFSRKFRWAEDASTPDCAFTLCYNTPAGKHLTRNSARIYVIWRKLINFTDYTGYDPEVASISNGMF